MIFKLKDLNVEIKKIDSKFLYIDNNYKELLTINITIDNKFFYDNYFILVNNYSDINDKVVSIIVNNLYDITFKYNKFIVESLLKGKKDIFDYEKSLIDSYKSKNNIDIICKEYENIKDTNKRLKYEAFFEIYFSTHSIPLDILKKEINKKTNLFNLRQLELDFKNKFKGKAQELSVKLLQLEKEMKVIDKSLYTNKIKICKLYLKEINDLYTKNKRYNSLIKERNSYKGINILKRIRLNNKIRYIESKFDYNNEYKDLIKNIRNKTNKDIIKSSNIKIDTLKNKIKEYITLLEYELETNTKKEIKLKKLKDSLYFDDIYKKLRGYDEK